MITPIFAPAFTPNAYHDFYSTFDSYNKSLVAVASSLMDSAPAMLLDLACGTGLSTSALEANFARARILGVDIDAALVEFAQRLSINPNISFRCVDIAQILDELTPRSVDLVFVKSAYHYFDQQVPLSRIKDVLSKGGTFIIAERTARSAQSYPLPNVASHHWTSFFGQHQVNRRFEEAQANAMELSVSCYGEFVQIPIEDYLAAVSANQLFGISALKAELVKQWVAKQLTVESNTVSVFEEFWLYLLRKKVSTHE
ncbi:MAG: class I SAM-dependent methyltransferase [Chloroflexota bacterium]